MSYPVLSREQFDRRIKPLRRVLCAEASRLCGPAEAECLVQQTLLAAWELRERFDANDADPRLLAWLLSLLRFACADHLRYAALHPEILYPNATLLEILDTSADSTLTASATLAEREALYTLLERVSLSGRQEVCVRLWLDAHTQAQIGAYLGISQARVCYHLREVKAKLAAARAQTVVHPGRHWFAEVSDATVYHAPPTLGSALWREKLRRLK